MPVIDLLLGIDLKQFPCNHAAHVEGLDRKIRRLNEAHAVQDKELVWRGKLSILAAISVVCLDRVAGLTDPWFFILTVLVVIDSLSWARNAYRHLRCARELEHTKAHREELPIAFLRRAWEEGELLAAVDEWSQGSLIRVPHTPIPDAPRTLVPDGTAWADIARLRQARAALYARADALRASYPSA